VEAIQAGETIFKEPQVGNNQEQRRCHNASADVVDHVPLLLLATHELLFTGHHVHMRLGKKEQRVHDQDDKIQERTQVVQLTHYGTLCCYRDQACLVGSANGAGQEGYPQDENATQVPGNVIPPVVSPVGEQKESHRAVEPNEDVSHVRVIIGRDGTLDLITASEQQ